MSESKPTRRWFSPTPGWLVLFSLATTGLLYLSERFQGFPFNHRKGWTVLVAVAAAAVVLLLMLAWYVAALLLRRRFQFSLRSLLVIGVALPFSWLAVEMRGANDQRTAVEAIVKAGGEIEYDYEFEYWYPDDLYHGQTMGGCVRQMRGQTCPAWLRRLLGDDFFANVVHVDASDPNVRVEEVLRHVNRLTNLQQLELTFNDSLESFEELKGLTQLRSLKCPGLLRGVTREQVQSLKSLEFLELESASDDGLKNFEGFEQLKGLCVNYGDVTDAGLRSIETLSGLQDLILRSDGGLPITDGGLQYI